MIGTVQCPLTPRSLKLTLALSPRGEGTGRLHMTKTVLCLPLLMIATLCAEDLTQAEKIALSPMQAFIGAWKGGGTVKDTPKEAWLEEADWSWEFKNGHAALVFTSPSGRYYSAGRLEPAAKNGAYRFIGVLPDGKTNEDFNGEQNKDGDLILTTATPAEGRPARITINTVARGKRLIMLYQRKRSGDIYSPIAELGLTRKGSDFGKDAMGPECIITGGVGTIAVQYKGVTYHVCCGGCKTTFLEDPEKELAAYRKRKEEK